MFEPARLTLPPVQVDGTYEVTLRLYADKAKTERLDLTAYTVKLDVTQAEVSVDTEVVVAAEDGEVTLTINRDITKTVQRTLHYVLWLEQEAGAKAWPVLDGTIEIERPGS